MKSYIFKQISLLPDILGKWAWNDSHDDIASTDSNLSFGIINLLQRNGCFNFISANRFQYYFYTAEDLEKYKQIFLSY